jgi:hypothetical protein
VIPCLPADYLLDVAGDVLDVNGAWPFSTFPNFILNSIAFFGSWGTKLGNMKEKVLAYVLRNKSETLAYIKKLNFAFIHCFSSFVLLLYKK